ncbi:ComEA family DNA-binding protein [Marinicella sp. W31]|uniref:ComEA family DNA-binding protein n=1 Tax=Marinicella sp. W31 TaxID=3023713 RepID=UPI0037577230
MKTIKAILITLSLFINAAIAAVNVNSADAETIAKELKGIGMTKAQAIVEYREANGQFQTVEQLTEVKGIGLKTVEKNREEILLK